MTILFPLIITGSKFCSYFVVRWLWRFTEEIIECS
nr:MAG TPA: hypothetical protein [Caudoviricetes sp.]